MPIIKSAKKRVITSAKKNTINSQKKSKVRTALKKFNAAIEAKDVELAKSLLPQTMSVIDSACSDGVFTKNTAARKKATICRSLDSISK